MANKVTGKVFGIYPKKINESLTLYSLKIDGDDTWYRLGKDSLNGVIAKDDHVEFEWETERGQPKVKVDTVRKVEPPKASSGSTSGSTGGGSNGLNVTDAGLRQSIGYAREQAIKVTQMLLDNGALELPAKTQVAKRHQVILGIIDNLTNQYLVNGFRLTVEDVEAMLVDTGSENDPMDYYGDDEPPFEPDNTNGDD